jgi:D-alanyl-D-alanine carboxypeptidase (penicillin-binding protein 5/6)
VKALRSFVRDGRLAFALATAAHAAAGEAGELLPQPPPALAFKSHYLVDFNTNEVLAASAPDARLPPASLTKLMTAYVVFDALRSRRIGLDDRARVSEKAWGTGGTRMFIEAGSEVAVEDLLHGLLVQSGNDAAVALAEHVSGSVDAFVAAMNAAAESLGMRNTHFRNPHGLHARDHYSSARDLAVLARAIIDEFPAFYGLYAEREFTYNGISQANRNALLWRDPSVDGLKTGYTSAAGYCLVTSAQRGGMRLIAVVLGAPTPRARNDGAAKLLDWGFANFETHKLYSAGQELDLARVWGGDSPYARLGLAEDIYVTIPRGGYAKLAASMEVLAQLAAPLASGTQVGRVKISFGDTPLVESPLVVLGNVLDGGVWARMRDELASLWE